MSTLPTSTIDTRSPTRPLISPKPPPQPTALSPHPSAHSPQPTASTVSPQPTAHSLNRQPSVLSRQSSARNCQPSVLSRQSSARNCQPSVLSRQSSAVSAGLGPFGAHIHSSYALVMPRTPVRERPVHRDALPSPESLPLARRPVHGQFPARVPAFQPRPGRSWRTFHRIKPSSQLLAHSRSIPRASVRLPAPPWPILTDLPPFRALFVSSDQDHCNLVLSPRPASVRLKMRTKGFGGVCILVSPCP